METSAVMDETVCVVCRKATWSLRTTSIVKAKQLRTEAVDSAGIIHLNILVQIVIQKTFR
jgi:hypothetical protein